MRQKSTERRQQTVSGVLESSLVHERRVPTSRHTQLALQAQFVDGIVFASVQTIEEDHPMKVLYDHVLHGMSGVDCTTNYNLAWGSERGYRRIGS